MENTAEQLNQSEYPRADFNNRDARHNNPKAEDTRISNEKSIPQNLKSTISTKARSARSWAKENPYKAAGIGLLAISAIGSRTFRSALKAAISFKAANAIIK